MSSSPITLREGVIEDAPFILNSWLKSYRVSNFARSMTNTVYYEGHHPVVRKILKRAKVTVACDPSHPSQIYGYIVHEMVEDIPVIHYCYVKHTFRNMGIASNLINSVKESDQAGVFTHHTKNAERIAPKHNLIHHPYLAFNDVKES